MATLTYPITVKGNHLIIGALRTVNAEQSTSDVATAIDALAAGQQVFLADSADSNDNIAAIRAHFASKPQNTP